MSNVCTKGKGKWMLSCNEVSELLSFQRDQISIGMIKKFQLKLHLYMCEMCKGFHSIITLPDKEGKLSGSPHMPTDMKVRILHNLESKAHGKI
ncbi:MAG: hypothetical protein MH321_13175 [Leptospiraceae bacterium]|nr:hypothetical protein [Leptospiraceae bacterium]